MLIESDQLGRIVTQMGMDHDVQAAGILQALASGILVALQNSTKIAGTKTGLQIQRSAGGDTMYKVQINHVVQAKNAQEHEAIISQLSTKDGALQFLASQGVN